MKRVGRLRVASGVVVVQGHVLLSQRDPQRSVDFGMCWETPGGKVEPGETERDAVARECLEELGLSVTLEHGDYLETYEFDPPVCRVPVRVTLYTAHADLTVSRPRALQVVGFGWFARREALALPLTPSTHALLSSPVGQAILA